MNNKNTRFHNNYKNIEKCRITFYTRGDIEDNEVINCNRVEIDEYNNLILYERLFSDWDHVVRVYKNTRWLKYEMIKDDEKEPVIMKLSCCHWYDENGVCTKCGDDLKNHKPLTEEERQKMIDEWKR